MADVYPKPEEELLDFLKRCKSQGSIVGLCPRCSALTDREAVENFRLLQIARGRQQWNRRDPRNAPQSRPKTYVPPADAPKDTWIKPQLGAETSNAAALREAKGKSVMNYRREVTSERKSHVSENYMGRNPMSRTQWRRFQRKKQAERLAAAAAEDVKRKNGNQRMYKVKGDPVVKQQIKTYVGKPVAKDSDEVTSDFSSESEASFDVLVNVVTMLPAEYNMPTDVENSDEVEAVELASHKPTC